METSDLPSDTNATKARCRGVLPLLYRYLYQPFPVSLMPLQDGGSKMMSRSRNYPYSMTLRLSSPMRCEVENLAYDSRMSKAQFIRTVLRRAIAHLHELPDQYRQDQGGAL